MTHHRRADLAEFFEHSKKIRGRFANTFFLLQKHGTGTPPEIAQGIVQAYVLASKKGVDKLANRSNRAKRRLRVAQRQILQNHPLPTTSANVRWVIMAGRGSLKAAWSDILKEVEQQWLNVLATLP